MPKSLGILALVFFGLGAVAGKLLPVPGGQRAEDQEAIRAHIGSIFQAYIQEDRKTIRATHSEDWRGFLRQSRSIIRGIDQYMEGADAALARPGGMVGYRMDDFDVLFYGDIALVPYIASLEVEFGGKRIDFEPKIRVLDVYAKEDGEWIQVASNTVRHPDTEAALRQFPAPVSPAVRKQILAAREAVWRAWFTNDQEELARLVPEETIAVNAGEEAWGDRTQILARSGEFVKNGGKLVSLDFPRTEIQLYGDVAILYTTYSTETVVGGESQTLSGRGTEIFVRRGGHWVNSGWHLDSGL
jgi:ketosteroid isomerase-like protein